MGKIPAFQFYPNDWSRDLEEHPLEIEGAWIRLCCKLWWSPTRGEMTRSIKQWSRLLSEDEKNTERILNYIKKNGIGDIETNCNGDVTIGCRRMKRDERERFMTRERVKRYRVKRLGNENVTSPSSSSSSFSSSKTRKKPRKVSSVETSDEVRLSKLLFDLIRERNPEFRPNFSDDDFQKWAIHVNRMIRIDKRDPDQIEIVIRWCQEDDFWKNNILSTQKLREQYDQLRMKMGKPKKEEQSGARALAERWKREGKI